MMLNMSKCHPITTPLLFGEKLKKEDVVIFMNSFTISMLSRFMNSSNHIHFGAIKKFSDIYKALKDLESSLTSKKI